MPYEPNDEEKKSNGSTSLEMKGLKSYPDDQRTHHQEGEQPDEKEAIDYIFENNIGYCKADI